MRGGSRVCAVPGTGSRCFLWTSVASNRGHQTFIGDARRRRASPTYSIDGNRDCCPVPHGVRGLPFSGGERVAGGFHGDGVDGGAGGSVERFEIFAAEGAVGG